MHTRKLLLNFLCELPPLKGEAIDFTSSEANYFLATNLLTYSGLRFWLQPTNLSFQLLSLPSFDVIAGEINIMGRLVVIKNFLVML